MTAVETEKPKRNNLKSISRVGQIADAFYEDLRRAPEEGRAVTWVGGFATPFPFLRAMDIAYLFEDVYAATAAARHMESKLQLVTANKGYLPTMCSYGRTTLGLAYLTEEEKANSDPYYNVPPPDFLIYIDPGCSMMPNWSDVGRRHFQKPLFGIQVPFVNSPGDEPEAIDHVARQFREMVVFLEDMTHQKFDWDRLRNMMVGIKELVDLRMEAKHLAGAAVPTPATFFDWAAANGVITYAIGTDVGLEVMRGINTEIKERVANGVGAIPDEQVRVFWLGHMCWPYMRWWGEMLSELGVAMVAANYSHLAFFHRPDWIDPNKPVESLAAQNLVCVTYGVEEYANQIIKMCRDYKLDAIICHFTQTCRVFPAPFFEIMEIVQRELGIPGIFFEGDVADPNFFAQEQARTRVEALKETVLSQRASVRA